MEIFLDIPTRTRLISRCVLLNPSPNQKKTYYVFRKDLKRDISLEVILPVFHEREIVSQTAWHMAPTYSFNLHFLKHIFSIHRCKQYIRPNLRQESPCSDDKFPHSVIIFSFRKATSSSSYSVPLLWTAPPFLVSTLYVVLDLIYISPLSFFSILGFLIFSFSVHFQNWFLFVFRGGRGGGWWATLQLPCMTPLLRGMLAVVLYDLIYRLSRSKWAFWFMVFNKNLSQWTVFESWGLRVSASSSSTAETGNRSLTIPKYSSLQM